MYCIFFFKYFHPQTPVRCSGVQYQSEGSCLSLETLRDAGGRLWRSRCAHLAGPAVKVKCQGLLSPGLRPRRWSEALATPALCLGRATWS